VRVKRNRQEKIVIPVVVFLVLLYLLPYLYLRETKAYKLPLTRFPIHQQLDVRVGLTLNRFYQPLIFLDRKITGTIVTFVNW